MKVIKPKTFTPALLAYSSAVETYATWAAGTTYAINAIVDYGQSLYRSLQASNLGRQPDTNPTWWVLLGPDNRHSMFDSQVSTATTATNNLTVVVDAGTINSAGLVGLVGKRLNVWLTSAASSFTSRASAATFVDYAGVVRTAATNVPRYTHDGGTLLPLGLLIEGLKINWILQSATFENFSWTKLRATVTANTGAAPDGTTAADTLTGDGTSGGPTSVHQSGPVSANAAYTLSVWAKAGTATWLVIYGFDGTTTAGQWFDLSAGTIGQTGTGMAAPRIQAFPGGWYRCSVSMTVGASATTLRMEFAQAVANGAALTGDTKTLSLWGAQLETGSVATSYIATTTSAVTRSPDVGSAGPVVYSRTVNLDVTIVADWYQYFFGESTQLGEAVFVDVPPYASSQLSVSIHGDSSVAVGSLAFGSAYDLGETQFGASAGITDYSIKETDEFGTVTFVPRPFAKRMTAQMQLDTAQINAVQRILAGVRAQPCVWVGDDNVDLFAPLVVFGWYRDFSIEVAYPTTSLVTLEIEGLT